MATDQPLQPTEPIEHRTTRIGRWLKARRIRFALWIAVIEGLIVAFTHFSRWVIISLAILLLPVYLFWGREARSDTARQLSWIAGASQSLAVLAVILSFFLPFLALIVAGVFAVIAVAYLFFDRD
jgi:hypothetical protein